MNERKSGLENDWKICRDQGVFFKNYKEKGNWKIRIQHFLDFVYYEYRKTRKSFPKLLIFHLFKNLMSRVDIKF